MVTVEDLVEFLVTGVNLGQFKKDTPIVVRMETHIDNPLDLHDFVLCSGDTKQKDGTLLLLVD